VAKLYSRDIELFGYSFESKWWKRSWSYREI